MPTLSQRAFLGASILLICFALWLRVTQLYSLPVFGDEADHLYWAQEFSVGQLNYPLLMDGKFLLGVLVAQFQPLGPEPLWVARAVVAIFSTFNIAACIYLGSRLGSRPAGLLAGLFYAALPQSVFHERQMLADPLMGAFGAVTIAFTWRLVSKRQGSLGFGLALALAATILTKLFGGLYLAYPGWAVLLFIRKHNWKRPALQLMAATGLGLLLTGGFLLALRPRLGQDNQALANNQVGFVHCPPLVCQGDLAQQIDDLGYLVPFFNESIAIYFGWPGAILSLLAWPLANKQNRRAVGWLFLSGTTTLVAFLLAVREFPPRYIFFVTFPIAVLAALAIMALVQRLHPIQPRLALGVGVALTVVALVPMANTIPMIASPRQSTLARLDADHWDTGYFRSGFQEAARFLIARDTGATPPDILVTGKSDRSLTAYLDRSHFKVERDTLVDFMEIGQRLLTDQALYYLEVIDPNTKANDGIWIPFNTTELARYYHTDRLTLRLSQIRSANADLRVALFRRYFTLPEELQQNYADLIKALPSDHALTLLVYPPNQAQTITPWVAASRSNVSVIPIGDSWPLDSPALDAELQSATATTQDVRLVFLQETNGDPQRLIETWLTTHLFRFEEHWFGPLRQVGYAGNGSVTQRIPVGGRFGDGIQLESVEVIDSVSQPGDLIRLRLTWRALAPIPQQFKIFTHIFTDDTIIAQHDGQPVGELRPTNTWPVGETIVDQFAIRLPPAAPPGDYQIRIGLYDLVTQVRPPVRLADGTQAEFFVGGVIGIR